MLGAIIIVFAVIIFLILVFAGWIVGIYNTLVTAFQDIKNQWSNVKTEYQRRADLFVNLAESVKSHARFEKTTLTEVIKARTGNFGTTPQQEMKSLKKLDNAFSRLLVTFERYPELHSNKLYKQLMEDVRETEDRVNVARTAYNDLVRDYNIYVKRFPNFYFANLFNYKEYEYFEVDTPEANKSPKMDLTV